MSYLKNRMREASTWASLAALIPATLSALATRDPAAIGAVVAGVAGVLIPERAAPGQVR